MDSGFYNVQLNVITSNGCEDSVTQQLEVYSLPLVSFDADVITGCAPLTVKFFNNSSNSVQYSWDFGDGFNSSEAEPVHTYTDAGTSSSYTVSLTAISSNGCTVINTKIDTIIILPNPIAAFSAEPNPATILFPYITFTNLSSGNLDPPVTFSWDFGDSTTFKGFDTIHVYSNTDTGTYLVQLIVENAYGCRDTVTSFLLTIEGDYTIFVPSAFTPNGDGFNDTFFPKGIGITDPDFQFTMSIYDRWGDLVYETDDPAKPWNGKANKGEKTAQEDVYVWMITTQDNTETVGKKHQYFGHVTLIR